jgi:centractin
MVVGEDVNLKEEVSKFIEKGKITNLEASAKLLEKLLEKIGSVGDGQIIIVTPSFNFGAEDKLGVLNILLRLGCKSVVFMSSPICALFATGRSTGFSLEIGEEVSTASPIYEGTMVSFASFSKDLGGKDSTQSMKVALEQQLNEVLTEVEIKAIKEKHGQCRHANCSHPVFYIERPVQDIKGEAPPRSVILSKEVVESPGEILFPGLVEIVKKSVDAIQGDIEDEILGNFVISGGTSVMPGFNERLLEDLKQVLPVEKFAKIRIADDLRRADSAWMGASLLGCLGTSSIFAITKQEFDQAKEDAIKLIIQKSL